VNWVSVGSFSLLTHRGDRRLSVNVCPSDTRWICAATEVAADAHISEIVRNQNHSIRIIDHFDTPLDAMRAAEKFAEEWERCIQVIIELFPPLAQLLTKALALFEPSTDEEKSLVTTLLQILPSDTSIHQAVRTLEGESNP